MGQMTPAISRLITGRTEFTDRFYLGSDAMYSGTIKMVTDIQYER